MKPRSPRVFGNHRVSLGFSWEACETPAWRSDVRPRRAAAPAGPRGNPPVAQGIRAAQDADRPASAGLVEERAARAPVAGDVRVGGESGELDRRNPGGARRHRTSAAIHSDRASIRLRVFRSGCRRSCCAPCRPTLRVGHGHDPASEPAGFCWLIKDGKRVPLVPGENILGRESDGGGIRIDSPTVSRRHARISISASERLARGSR